MHFMMKLANLIYLNKTVKPFKKNKENSLSIIINSIIQSACESLKSNAISAISVEK